MQGKLTNQNFLAKILKLQAQLSNDPNPNNFFGVLYNVVQIDILYGQGLISEE